MLIFLVSIDKKCLSSDWPSDLYAKQTMKKIRKQKVEPFPSKGETYRCTKCTTCAQQFEFSI